MKKDRRSLFRLINYKSAGRRGYFSSVTALIKNAKKYDGSEMEIFKDSEWKPLSLSQAEKISSCRNFI